MMQERANGLYGPTEFLIANFFIGLPFLRMSIFPCKDLIQVIIAVLFSVITYWWLNLRPGTEEFFNYFGIFYLDLLVAESLVVALSSICPIFVVILSLSALINGLWMTVGGFLVNPNVLNSFWKYTFYQIDYQRFTFVALVRNQMMGNIYSCAEDCHCEYVTSLQEECLIDGTEVVEQLGYTMSNGMCFVGYPAILN
jgi:ABC-2 type transporter